MGRREEKENHTRKKEAEEDETEEEAEEWRIVVAEACLEKQTCTLFGGPLTPQRDSNSVTSRNRLAPGVLLSHSSCLSSAPLFGNLTHGNQKVPKMLLKSGLCTPGQAGGIEG